MKPITEQWKQHLIAQCKVVMSVKSKGSPEYFIAEIALASLTAVPVGFCKQYDVEALQRGEFAGISPDDPECRVSLYTAPPVPVIPDGYVLVPQEPTEEMIIRGFESCPSLLFSDEEGFAEYEAMSGCQQAAHKAKLCWHAMIDAATSK